MSAYCGQEATMVPAVSTAIVRSFPLSEALGMIKEAGFDNVEIGYQHLSGPADVVKVVETAARAHVTVTSIHLPFGGLDISDLEEANRRQVCDVLGAYIKHSAEQGIKLVVLHPNSYSKAADRAEYDAKNKQTEVSLLELGDLAVELGICIAIENQPCYWLRAGGDIAKLREMVLGLGCDHLGLCVDTVHAGYNSLDPIQQIECAGSLLRAVHLSDDIAGKHRHSVPGQGEFDWQAILRALWDVEYPGLYTMDVYGPRSAEDEDQTELLLRNKRILADLHEAWQRLQAWARGVEAQTSA